MKKIENYENIQASSGEFARPTAGGYICKIINVVDVPLDENTGKGNYLKIEYDICDGEFKGYYREQFEKWGGSWFASFIRSYKEKALGMFKHFTSCVEESNSGYVWDWNETGLIGNKIGLVLGEEEYKNQTGETKIKLVVKDVKLVEDIKKGNFKIPAIKKIVSETTTNDFVEVDDDELPF